MRVLSIDPAVRNTGYAVLEGDPRKPTVLAFDVISIPKNIPQSAALSAIRTHLVNIIQKFQPDEVAVEGIIYVQSHQTAISMGAARAAALIAAADHGLRVYEYAPRKVKSAVVGNGNADKSQVAFMVRALLGLSETPPPDAADALAIAIAHLQASDPLKAKLLDRRLVNRSGDHRSPSRSMLHILHLPEPLTYEAGLRLQEQHVDAILAGTGVDTILLLEHEPVYTIGRLRDQSSLRDATSLPHPVFETNRGGQATYHGPGQLVGYPILDLTPRGRDLHEHLRKLEDALIRACAAFGVTAGRREGLTGVWVENRKLASIGVGVRKWISMHGFAINITNQSLPPFFAITPCGLDGVSMTSLESEAGREITVAEAAAIMETELRIVFE